VVPLLLGLIILIVVLSQLFFSTSVVKDEVSIPVATTSDDWQAPDINSLPMMNREN
jgi:hypothetical protein